MHVPHPPYLHENELEQAVRAISLVATGRNPFSNEPFETLRPNQRDSILQALCVVVSSLANLRTDERADTASPGPKIKPPDLGVSKRPLEKYLDAIERDAILEALEETHWNKTAAAKLLGITFRALRYRLANLGIDDDEADGDADPA